MGQLKFLFLQWLKRDLEGRYRGSWLGLLWPILQPLAQIAVFTLIFHEFMQVRWPSVDGDRLAGGSAWGYAQNVLAGLAVFNFFAEILGRAPSAVLAHPNLVTKVKFPLWLLPVVTVASASTHILAGFIVLLASVSITGQAGVSLFSFFPWLLPMFLYGVGLALLLSSLGVYIRDFGQIMPAVTSLLMFLTPIFYPLSAVPERVRGFFELNPITWGAEGMRGILLETRPLAWSDWSIHFLVSLILALFGLFIFRALDRGFADVL